MCRLRAEKAVGHSAAKRSTEAFVFRPLHQNHKDEQKRYDNMYREQRINENIQEHRGGEYG
jgi:hypothetical protein